MPVARTWLRGRVADPRHQRRIVRRAEPDVVREKRRAVDIVVAVDGVGAPDHRHLDRHVGRHRRAIIFVGQLQPVVDARVHVHRRPGAAAVEDRAEIIAANLVGRDRANVGLGDLPDLLLERHAGDDRANAGVDRGFRRAGTAARGQIAAATGAEASNAARRHRTTLGRAAAPSASFITRLEVVTGAEQPRSSVFFDFSNVGVPVHGVSRFDRASSARC